MKLLEWEDTVKKHAFATKPAFVDKEDLLKAQYFKGALADLFSKGIKNPLLRVHNGATGVMRKLACFALLLIPNQGKMTAAMASGEANIC